MDEEVAVPSLAQALGHLRIALETAYEEASRSLGISSQQAELLCASLAPAAVGDLASALRCDRSNVSRLVDRAEARSLARRSRTAEDGRVTVVELTPAGRQIAERVIAALAARAEAAVASWPEERRNDAAELLEDLAGALDRTSRPRPHGADRRRTRGASARA